MDKAKRNGFTLVELMVVVAIAAIITAIALPNYSDYVTRGKIPYATSNLATKRVQMEQWFQDNHTYVGYPNCTTIDTTTAQYFTFSCTLADQSYTLTATGTGTMAGFVYTIDETNDKSSTISATGWTGNTACWVTNKNGSC